MTALFHAHSGIRYLVLAAGLLALGTRTSGPGHVYGSGGSTGLAGARALCHRWASGGDHRPPDAHALGSGHAPRDVGRPQAAAATRWKRAPAVGRSGDSWVDRSRDSVDRTQRGVTSSLAGFDFHVQMEQAPGTAAR